MKKQFAQNLHFLFQKIYMNVFIFYILFKYLEENVTFAMLYPIFDPIFGMIQLSCKFEKLPYSFMPIIVFIIITNRTRISFYVM